MCVFTVVCVHLDGLNVEHEFRVWVSILGCVSLSNQLIASKIKGCLHNMCVSIVLIDMYI